MSKRDLSDFRFGDGVQLLDGSRLPDGVAGASDLLLDALRRVLAAEDDRPLLIRNFLERLDEAVDLRPVFRALSASGRQVILIVPENWEDMPMLPAPFDLRATEEYRKFGFRIVRCPVCGHETLDSYFICPTCGWEYDGWAKEREHSHA